MRLAIIDYGSGNLRSVAKAFERISGDAESVQVTSDAKTLADASHIVLPGVGAFADCMRGLTALPGMLGALQEEVLSRKKPFLGICVGMQMLFERGHEHGVHAGLGWLKGEVVPLAVGSRQFADNNNTANRQLPTANPLKIPHMGWNELSLTQPHGLLAGVSTGDHAYFVHSYHAQCADASDLLATTDYGQSIAAVVGRGNILGTQFHPEKSQATGLRLLANFLTLA